MNKILLFLAVIFCSVNSYCGWVSSGGGGGGGTAIGEPVPGGTANRVLTTDSSGNLADSGNLTTDGSNLSASSFTASSHFLAPDGDSFVGGYGFTSAPSSGMFLLTSGPIGVAIGREGVRNFVSSGASGFSLTAGTLGGGRVDSSDASVVPFTVRGTTGQSANLIETQQTASSGVSFSVGPTGAIEGASLSAEGNITTGGFSVYESSAITIPSDGAGTIAAYTLAPTRSLVILTCQDTDGCDITMSEASAVDGARVAIFNVSANTTQFFNTSGVSEIQGDASTAGLSQYQSFQLMYITDRWIELR